MAQQSLEKSKIKFLLLEGVHPSAVEALQKSGYSNIEQHKKALPPAELKLAIANAQSRMKMARKVVRKKVTSGPALPGKLADCTSQDLAMTELFMVEGEQRAGAVRLQRHDDE